MKIPEGAAIVLGTAAAYGVLCLRLYSRNPRVHLAGPFLLLFATYGALLYTLLAAAHEFSPDAAKLALMYLLLAAPFALLLIAAQLRPLRKNSPYHQAAFYASAIYPALWVVLGSAYFLMVLRYAGGE